MKTKSFLPADQNELRLWANSYLSVIENFPLGPATVGMSEAQGSAFADAANAYNAAYLKANTEATRGPLSTAEKNHAADTLRQVARECVATVQAFPGTTNDQRSALQITIPGANPPTPVPKPSTSPVLNITGVIGNRILLDIRDTADPDRRRKPTGVTGITLLYHVGPTAPMEVSGWTFGGSVTRLKTELIIPASVAPGSKVFVVGFWTNTKLESGPASAVASTFVQGVEGGLDGLRLAA